MTDQLQVAKRERTGSAATRQLRRNGHVPAVLYGHGENNVHLSIPQAQVAAIVRNHVKTVSLSGDVKDTALVSEMQFDPLGIEVLHMDLIRVNLKEEVEVMVSIHSHGEPAGLRDGGVLIENAYEVEVRCSAGAIPENVGLNVNALQIGEHLTAGDLELPDGVELVTPADTVVAHMEEPREEIEGEEVPEAEGAEPEVIARGGEEEQEETTEES